MEDQVAVALRVIKAFSSHSSAAPDDVALLRAWAAPDDDNCDPDELACMVIQETLKQRIRPPDLREKGLIPFAPGLASEPQYRLG